MNMAPPLPVQRPAPAPALREVEAPQLDLGGLLAGLLGAGKAPATDPTVQALIGVINTLHTELVFWRNRAATLEAKLEQKP